MADATATQGGMARLKAFPRAFWVINGIELFERGAYYSLSAVFTVFMAATFREAGMAPADAAARAGLIWSVLFFLLYIIPVLSSSFSERVGYKASLTVVFVLLVAGYASAFLATQVDSVTTDVFLVLGAVTLIGLGAGVFKPIAAALVAQTTREDQRNFGFSIYYAFINIGAFVFPVSVGLAAQRWPESQAQIAFSAALALSTVNFLLTLFVYRNVREPQKDVNVVAGIKRLGEVFRYPSFLVLMAIYSGFWFMYAISLTFITAYMGDFGRMPGWFNESLQQSINPLVIIAFTPLLGLFTHRFNSLPLMIVGILVYAAGFVVVGFTGTSALFLMGIIVFSTGELLTHPSYLSYVSKIAPPGKESLFLGYGFIPIAVGLTLGSSIGGSWYGTYALEQGRPQLFWAILASIGLVTVAALLIYNRALTKSKAPAQKRAPSRSPGVAALVFAVIAILLIPAIVGAANLAPVTRPDTTGTEDDLLANSNLASVKLATLDGESAAGETAWSTVEFPANATGLASVLLTWSDESATGPSQTNAPDELRVHVKYPNGTMLESSIVANPQSGEGKIELPIDAVPGAYEIGVEVVSAGGVSTQVGPVALPGLVGGAPDAGNAWTLAVSTQTAA